MIDSTPFTPRILVAESPSADQRLLESTLRSMGAEPLCISNDPEGRFLIDRKKIDGAFVDWDDAHLDGREITRAIRNSKSNSRIPVAMITVSKTTGTVTEAFQLGVTFFLPKPFSTSEIVHLINAMRGSMLEERRRYLRVPVSVPVLCVWGSANRDKQTQAGAKSINISSKGLLLRLSPQPELGTMVSMDFLLPEVQEVLKVRGVVRRKSPAQDVGVEFVGISKSQRTLVENFIIASPSRSLFQAE
jgi:DNA-binding response OmpR family regulator